MTEFKCKNCGFPTAGSTVFKDDETPFAESLHCPKCKCPDIVDS